MQHNWLVFVMDMVCVLFGARSEFLNLGGSWSSKCWKLQTFWTSSISW